MKVSKGLFFVLAISLTLVGLLLTSLLVGYRYFSVVSPSMGETAPVGTLVVTLPKDQYSVNDIVSFHRGSRIYTHRIIETDKDGNYITKGDLNDTADALPLKHDQIIGSSVFMGKYLGWVWQGLPLLAIGFTLAYLLSLLKKVKDPWRWPVRIIGFTLTIVIVTIILNPWLRVDLLHYNTSPNGGVDMRVVNTGVFPIRDDNGGRFYAGQVAQVHTDEVDFKGRFIYIPRPSLGFWGVILALLWCLSPMILALTVRLPLSDEEKNLTEKEIEREKRYGLIIFSVVTTASVLILLLQLSTMAAFTAVINNDNNTAVVPSRAYDKCHQVMDGTSFPRPLFAYSMDRVANQVNTGSWWNPTYDYTTQDISGNNQTGHYATNITSSELSYEFGCHRDTPHQSTIFNGSNHCLANLTRYSNPTTFSVEVWFKAYSGGSNNGKLIGFGIGGTKPSDDTTNDRNVYLDKDGRLVFGVYPGEVRIAASPVGKSYADNYWHHVVAALSSEGMKLYADGRLVGENSNTSAQYYAGYWKFGCGRLSGWQHGDGSSFNGRDYFNGRLQYGAVYDRALTPVQVWQHYLAGAA